MLMSAMVMLGMYSELAYKDFRNLFRTLWWQISNVRKFKEHSGVDRSCMLVDVCRRAAHLLDAIYPTASPCHDRSMFSLFWD